MFTDADATDRNVKFSFERYKGASIGDYATVSGGDFNTASGARSSVSGGVVNTASGVFSSVSGGRNRTAQGESDWVAGGLFKISKKGLSPGRSDDGEGAPSSLRLAEQRSRRWSGGYSPLDRRV
jgi:hypothetical protein